MSFFDMFGPLFDPSEGANRSDRQRSSNDDPIILNVETDGDTTSRSGSSVPPKGPSRPRIARRPNRPRKGASRGNKILIGIVLALAIVVGLFFALAQFITDVMWYDQLGFQSVIWTQLGTRIGLWIAYALLLAGVSFISATLAIRARPDAADGSTIRVKGDTIEIGKGVSSRNARRVAVVVSLIVGLIFGAQFNSNWSEILLMFNAQSFGTTDPQFGLDNGFYVFVLPGLRLIMSAVSLLLLAGIIFSVITHVLMGGIRITMPVNGRGLFNITKRARRQIGIWLMLNMFAWAANQVVGVFSTLTTEGSRITGATYTTVNATIPVTFVMAAITVILGVVLGIWIMKSHALEGQAPIAVRASEALKAWKVPTVAIASAVVVSLVLTVAWPMLLQRFRVNPNAQEMESTYIQRNIDATRVAYGLNKVKTEQYKATTEGEAGALADSAESTAQIRLLDPQIVSPTFKQLQQSKQYYTFADTLSVDKYEVDGVSQDTVIAARELDLDGLDNRNWVNDHTVYTHGYGVVAAYGNKVTSDGQPKFFESGIPNQGKLTDSEQYEPRIYFSPNASEYSIVGAPDGTKSWEFDYPTGSEGATNTFKGDGGPKIGNIFSRLLYAIRFGSDQILFSDRVNANSQILYDRSPKERVAKVAPYLTLDGRVYPAVVDGRVKWIVDGYTTSDAYPYSQMTDLGDATKDSTTETSSTVTGLNSQNANYIRNSVKATVDAYDGSVDLYVWDESDPVIKAWEQIFPGQYHQLSEISGDLMSHLRYPESLFKVQRELLAKYHVSSANQFFSGEDFWQTPVDPTESQQAQQRDILQPPYYLTLQTGGSNEPVFSLTSSYIPAGSSTREILTGFLSVDSDAGNEKGKIGSNYGTIRLQELPKDSNVPGPGQAQNNFNASADVSKELNLLESGSTNVQRGNLLTLPLGGGLVYVQPVYVKSSGSTSFPLLKKVLVAFGDQVGFANTLDEALDQVFGGNSGASAGDAENVEGGTSSGKTDGKTDSSGQQGDTSQGGSTDSSTGNDTSGTASGDLKNALNDAAQAMKDSDAAMKKGDWSAYGEAQKKLQEALNKAIELEQ
ncbi:UPF0182 family protein [Bifidobacterium dentium]|uniref:UPF0182 protein BDP_0866 n=1 Tax=Bifidobacterium dentium (strain ATCC 27534 / DSM 20436 / JCM 1195 / Bd1) TaxID=401473 RepID=D2Q9N5_BIFDB|nr:UPF0182 family protein [Bifidobacterium dentium]ADB09521.1 Conserved hypothetical protein [Bifidobacterium dentium Bd1]EDT46516.1 hypothetical protein BIFDEN_02370 [Bifidobacterium dentium ATCC 27678]SEB60305.1 hypothetical protein SAMN05192536_0446 [Bifidobacterium dentium JCM 1195 = DSM 20436]VEG23483.1 norm2 [Bifidobacterium dentium]BAQ26820.1 conserved hypothetical protein [Bifidobacterium dentium JCM 1195 = DSM 20436]